MTQRSYYLHRGGGGRSEFQLASPQGAGDENWADGYAVPNDVYSITRVASDGRGHVYASFFPKPGNTTATAYIAQWDGATWAALGAGMSGMPNTMLVDSQGNLYVGGYFQQVGGVPVQNIAKWDGSHWSALGAGVDIQVSSLLVDKAGNLYAAGAVPPGLRTIGKVFKWANGQWTMLGESMDNDVYALALDEQGTLYAGGWFTTIGSLPACSVARWDGTHWSAVGLGGYDPTTRILVNSLAIDTGGTVYAGGDFNRIGGKSLDYIAQWNGTEWQAVGTGVDRAVTSLVADANGNVYAGGYFTQAGGLATSKIAKWDGTNWSGLGSGLNGAVWGLSLSNNTDLYVGGNFTAVGDGSKASQALARYRLDNSPALALPTGSDQLRGAIGSTVTLTGAGLVGAQAVTFSGTGATSVTTGFVANATGTALTGVVVPAGAKTGVVRVTTARGTSNGVVFTVTTPLAGKASSASGALFPNPIPAGAALTLRLAEPAAKATLTWYSALGQPLRTEVVTGPQATVSTTGLGTGLFLLQVQAAGQNTTMHRVILY